MICPSEPRAKYAYNQLKMKTPPNSNKTKQQQKTQEISNAKGKAVKYAGYKMYETKINTKNSTARKAE